MQWHIFDMGTSLYRDMENRYFPRCNYSSVKGVLVSKLASEKIQPNINHVIFLNERL